MPRDYKQYLQDILEACGKIEVYTSGYTFESFKSGSKTFDAVLRNLEIIGEAAKFVPDEVRASDARIDWKSIASLGSILAHAYFGVDAEIIWDIVKDELPALRAEVQVLVTGPPPASSSHPQ
jgi:uncharacterized protein with HEPN domain